MSVRKRAVIPLIVMLILLLTSLSGCIGPRGISQKLVEKFGEKQRYEWDAKLEDKKSFNILDVINQNFAKVVNYPPIEVKPHTRYMHLYVHVNFSNLINQGWTSLTLGYVNITITNPSGLNTSREYSTLGKGNEYEDFFYFVEPQKGNWEVTLRVRGTGSYKIFAEVYEPT